MNRLFPIESSSLFSKVASARKCVAFRSEEVAIQAEMRNISTEKIKSIELSKVEA